MRTEPVAVIAAIKLTLLAAVAFGLDLTGEQIAAVVVALEAWSVVLVRKRVSPVE
jgi:hypothetical protein